MIEPKNIPLDFNYEEDPWEVIRSTEVIHDASPLTNNTNNVTPTLKNQQNHQNHMNSQTRRQSQPQRMTPTGRSSSSIQPHLQQQRSYHYQEEPEDPEEDYETEEENEETQVEDLEEEAETFVSKLKGQQGSNNKGHVHHHHHYYRPILKVHQGSSPVSTTPKHRVITTKATTPMPRIHNPIPMGCLLTIPIFHPIQPRNHLACVLSIPGTPNLYRRRKRRSIYHLRA